MKNWSLMIIHFTFRYARKAKEKLLDNVGFCSRRSFSFWLHINKQNYHIWYSENPNVDLFHYPLFHASITSDCLVRLVEPILLLKMRITQPLRSLQKSIEPWYSISFVLFLHGIDVNDVWFQQDCPSCHAPYATIDLLFKTFEGPLIIRNGNVNWPQRSFVLAPLTIFYGESLNKNATPTNYNWLPFKATILLRFYLFKTFYEFVNCQQTIYVCV